MIKDMMIAALVANCHVECPAVQKAIDTLADEFRDDRAHMFARLPLLDREDFCDLLMVAWGTAPMLLATGRTREEWLHLLNAESKRLAA